MASASLDAAAEALREAEDLSSKGYEMDLVWERSGQALRSANEALVGFRRDQNLEGRKNAVDIIVKASLLMGDTFAGLAKAQDELTMIKKEFPSDKASQAEVMEMVITCFSVRGDVAGGATLVQELLEFRRELNDKAGEAKALRMKAALKLDAGQPKTAEEIAQESVKIYKELKDGPGQEMAARVLSQAFCQKGQPDKAPGREEALRALEALGAAMNAMDAEAFAASWGRLQKSGAFLQSDLDDCILRGLNEAQDRRKDMKHFLKDLGMDMTQYGGATVLEGHDTRQTYQDHRLSGMLYGPSMRSATQSYTVGCENEAPTYSAVVLQAGNDPDDGGWERELQFHPGVLDGMVQGALNMKLF